MIVVCSKTLGEWLFFDVSSPLTHTFRCEKQWLLDMEDSTNCMWSYFLKEKLDLKNVVMGLIKKLKTKYNIWIQYLQFDNVGESVDFERACKQEGMGMKFKYIAPGNPQQNGHIEWKFTTLLNQVLAMLNGRKFTAFLRNSL